MRALIALTRGFIFLIEKFWTVWALAKQSVLGTRSPSALRSWRVVATLQLARMATAAAAASCRRALAGANQPDSLAAADLLVRLAQADPYDAQAESHLRAALALYAKAKQAPALEGDAMLQLSSCVEERHDRVEAERLLWLAVDKKVAARNRGQYDLIEALNRLAMIYLNSGRFRLCRALYAHLLKRLTNAALARYRALAAMNLAVSYDRAGDYEEARRHYAQALQDGQRAYGARHVFIALAMGNDAHACTKLGDLEAAGRSLQLAFDVLKNCSGSAPDYWRGAIASSLHVQQAKLELAQGLPEAALSSLAQAAQYAQSSALRLAVEETRADALCCVRKPEEARALFEQVLECYRQHAPSDTLEHARCLDNYGLCLQSLQRAEQAHDAFEKAKAMREAAARRDGLDDVAALVEKIEAAESPLAQANKWNQRRESVSLVLALVGTVFLWQLLSTEQEPYALYWQAHMPAVLGLLWSTLIAVGCLLYTARFSLRSLMLAVLFVAGISTFCQWRSTHAVRTELHWNAIKDALPLTNEGLLNTLRRLGCIDAQQAPVCMSMSEYGYPQIHTRPHADRRVRGLESAVWLITSQHPGPLDVETAQANAESYFSAVAEHFGAASAEQVAAETSKYVTDPELKMELERLGKVLPAIVSLPPEELICSIDAVETSSKETVQAAQQLFKDLLSRKLSPFVPHDWDAKPWIVELKHRGKGEAFRFEYHWTAVAFAGKPMRGMDKEAISLMSAFQERIGQKKP